MVTGGDTAALAVEIRWCSTPVSPYGAGVGLRFRDWRWFDGRWRWAEAGERSADALSIALLVEQRGVDGERAVHGHRVSGQAKISAPHMIGLVKEQVGKCQDAV